MSETCILSTPRVHSTYLFADCFRCSFAGLPSNHHLFLLLGLSVWECSRTRVAETSTMAQLIPGDASIVVTRLLILVVWGVTPFCWLALVSRALRFYLNRYTTYSLDAALWRAIVAHAPARITAVLQKLLSPKWRWASTPFYVYCAAEAAFSIYHWHLSRVIQRPGPRPLYGRRFLRGVFAQALQAVSSIPPTRSRRTPRPSPPRSRAPPTATRSQSAIPTATQNQRRDYTNLRRPAA